MRDFSHQMYLQLLRQLQKAGYDYQTLNGYIDAPLPRSVILRHDIDITALPALRLARLEKQHGIQGSYYFRTTRFSFRPKIMREIAALGHEIGYHYEDLTRNDGNMDLAIRDFRENLARFREIAPVKTVCMHGINYAIETSLKSFNIPLVIKGSGRRVQYVSQLKGVSVLNTPAYYENVIKGTSVYERFKHLARYKNKLERQKIIGGVSDILGIPRSSLMRFVPQHIGMYDYIYLPYTEIIPLIKIEMGWSDFGGTAEHLDCELHDVPFFKNTLVVPNITKSTLHNSGLLRQGIVSKEEALTKEREEAKAADPRPPELLNFLSENGLTYEEYVNYVKGSIDDRFAPRFQKIIRDIYHRFRKF